MKRVYDVKLDELVEVEMETSEIQRSELQVAIYVNNFNYKKIYQEVINTQKMLDHYTASSSNYEKLQIYRIIKETS
jgi:hypothetical protein